MDQGRLESHDLQGKIQTALHLVDDRTLLLLPKARFGFPLLAFSLLSSSIRSFFGSLLALLYFEYSRVPIAES